MNYGSFDAPTFTSYYNMHTSNSCLLLKQATKQKLLQFLIEFTILNNFFLPAIDNAK